MTTFEQIFQQLKKKQFSPVYLLMGDEPFFIDQIADYIEENAIEQTQRDFNQVILYGKDTDVEEVIALAKEFPFGSNKKVIIIKEAKDLKNIDRLKSYVEKPAHTTILVLCHKYAKLKATQYKSFEKSGIVFVSEKIKDNKVATWVQSRAAIHQFQIQPLAANIITEHIGNDLDRIENEFIKLKIFLPPNSEITPDIIEKYIGISKEYNIFELQNALVERNLPKVYKITYNFCYHLKENPNIKTIANLYSFYSKMLAYHLSDKTPDIRTKIFGNLPPFILELNCSNAMKHSLHELKKIISLLREYDVKSKGVDNISGEDELLKEMIYKITH